MHAYIASCGPAEEGVVRALVCELLPQFGDGPDRDEEGDMQGGRDREEEDEVEEDVEELVGHVLRVWVCGRQGGCACIRGWQVGVHAFVGGRWVCMHSWVAGGCACIRGRKGGRMYL